MPAFVHLLTSSGLIKLAMNAFYLILLATKEKASCMSYRQVSLLYSEICIKISVCIYLEHAHSFWGALTINEWFSMKVCIFSFIINLVFFILCSLLIYHLHYCIMWYIVHCCCTIPLIYRWWYCATYATICQQRQGRRQRKPWYLLWKLNCFFFFLGITYVGSWKIW